MRGMFIYDNSSLQMSLTFNEPYQYFSFQTPHPQPNKIFTEHETCCVLNNYPPFNNDVELKDNFVVHVN